MVPFRNASSPAGWLEPVPLLPGSQQSWEGATLCQDLAALMLLSYVLAGSPLPLSLFKGLIFAALIFLAARLVLCECHTSEGGLPWERGLIVLFCGGFGGQVVPGDGRKTGHSPGLSAEEWTCLH